MIDATLPIIMVITLVFSLAAAIMSMKRNKRWIFWQHCLWPLKCQINYLNHYFDEINKHLTKTWHSYFGPDKILKKNGILIIDTLQSFCFRYKIESIILFTIWYSFQSRIRYILLHLWVSWQWIYVLKTGRWYMGKWKTFSLSK